MTATVLRQHTAIWGFADGVRAARDEAEGVAA